jgi:UDP-N-acetylmuramate dehydrogenase
MYGKWLMSWWKIFAEQMATDVVLAPMTWFRLGGRARFLFRPRDEDQLAKLIRRSRQEGVSAKFLGGGANVLVRDDGFDGVVVRLDQPAFRGVAYDGGMVTVGAGMDLMPFSKNCASRGLSGLEPMAGIPGTVGGAIRMNAGGPAGEFGDVVDEVRLVDREGEVRTWTRCQVAFSYRNCAISDQVLVSARLRLDEEDPGKVESAYAEQFARKQQTQPLANKSAGCIFKNPPGASAGQLIDRAGLKGTRVGGASVSTQHANFIVAEHGATATDVLHLIDRVREQVVALFGTELETEIDIW